MSAGNGVSVMTKEIVVTLASGGSRLVLSKVPGYNESIRMVLILEDNTPGRRAVFNLNDLRRALDNIEKDG